MAQMDPYNNSGWTHLHSLAQLLARHLADTGQPSQAANRQGVEPSTDTAAENEALRNPAAKTAGEAAVDAEMDKANTESWSQRMKEAKEASPKGKARSFVNKMRAAREGQKAVGKELDKPPPPLADHLKPYEYLIGQRPFVQDENGNEIPTPAISADNLETYLRTGRTDGVVDPRAGQTGEDAVRKALQDINMKPLIEEALRQQAIRDLIANHIANNPPPAMPESQFPENMNRPPGSEVSTSTIHDYSLLPEMAPGVKGVGTPPLKPPLMPPPVNVIPGTAGSLIYGPKRTNPDQPHFPVGIDPNLTPPQPPVE